jgi:hypothetical protein
MDEGNDGAISSAGCSVVVILSQWPVEGKRKQLKAQKNCVVGS